MLDDKTLALLGDREAQERLTAAGVLLECPFCGSEPSTRVKVKAQYFEMTVVCFKCGVKKVVGVEICDTEFGKMENGMIEAGKMWNTRAPLLTPAQMAMLGIAREPRKLEVDVNVDDA